jgi:hypothetical protein
MLSAATTNLFGMGDTEMSRNIENMSLEKFNRRLIDIITCNLLLEFARVTESCYGIR